MLVRRLPDGTVDSEEVAHHRDVAERHAGLRHAERTRVHADHEHFARPLRPEALEVRLVRRAGVDERVVDDVRGREAERVDLRRELATDADEASTSLQCLAL